MFIPELVVVDFETSSLSYYSPEFRVISMAMAYIDAQGNLSTKFSNVPEEMEEYIKFLSENKVPVAVYNAGFEIGIFNYYYPQYPVNVAVDVMRLVQVFDNGNDDFVSPFRDQFEFDYDTREDGTEIIPEGLGLKIAGPRILGHTFIKAETEAYQWIHENLKVSIRQAGAHLGKLPYDILKKYNEADVTNTYNLYKYIIVYFSTIEYDWTHDHALYLNSARLIVESQARGINVKREPLKAYLVQLEEEIQSIGREFKLKYIQEISDLEDAYWEEEKAIRKTEKGKAGVKRPVFNEGSNHQLADLFIKHLNVKATFFTPSGQPSFKKAHLHSWGAGGEILLKRRQRMIVLSQVRALLELSEEDSKWHSSLRTAGTSTGRYVSA